MKEMKIRSGFMALLVALICFSLSCGGDDSEDSGSDLQSLDELIQVGSQRAVNRNSIDWDALSIELTDTYAAEGFDEAVRVFLSALGDNQSFYGRLSGANIFSSEANCSSSGFSFAGMSDDIGYIQMREFIGSQNQSVLYAGDRHNRARTQDSPNIRGWVVDLTTTSGGEIYSQIAALGMFFDREVLGYFINPDEEIPFGYNQGAAFLRSTAEVQTQVADPYTLMDPNGKLVVVMDLATAGAGEAAVLALSKRPNTLILGRPTCGLATVTQSFTLSNSDFIVIATHFIADSDKDTFTSRLQPDEQIGNSSELIARIEEWLD